MFYERGWLAFLQHWGVRSEMKKWSSGQYWAARWNVFPCGCRTFQDSDLDSPCYSGVDRNKEFQKWAKVRATARYDPSFVCHPVFIILVDVVSWLLNPTSWGQGGSEESLRGGHTHRDAGGWWVLRWSPSWEQLLAGVGMQGWEGPKGDSKDQEDWKGPKAEVSSGAELSCWKKTLMPSRNLGLRTSPADLTESPEKHLIHVMRKSWVVVKRQSWTGQTSTPTSWSLHSSACDIYTRKVANSCRCWWGGEGNSAWAGRCLRGNHFSQGRDRLFEEGSVLCCWVAGWLWQFPGAVRMSMDLDVEGQLWYRWQQTQP